MASLGIGLLFGFFFIVLGAFICLYWYIYWEHNFKGELLTDGPYNLVRHPFYSGFIIFTIGLNFIYPIYEIKLLLVFTLAVILFYIPREEEQLLKEYKKNFQDYMVKVKWKLIPYIY